MAISFLPGEPNRTANAVDTAFWNEQRIVAYCSGNNVIILDNSTTLLQTIYLKKDGVAVRIEHKTGRIAVAYGDEVLILKPVIMYDKPTKWEEICVLREGEKVECLSWSSGDEIVVGSTSLTLWALPQQVVWRKKLANPVFQVEVSPDSCLIASIAKNDRLVKVWRRLSFDLENPWFDFVYLPHPRPVSGLRWKRPLFNSQTIENTLYTGGQDSILRVWSPYDTMDSANLQLWCSIDMNDQGKHQGHRIYPFVVDNGDLTRAIESCIARKETGQIARLGRKQAEMCVIVDSEGHCDIYTIENVGIRHKQQQKLAKLEKVLSSKINLHCLGSDKLIFQTFSHLPQDPSSTDLSVLVHDLSKGVLFHYTMELDRMLSGKPKWHLKSTLTGHNKSVRSVMRAADGESLLSQSRFNENLLWKPQMVGHGITMRRTSLIRGKIVRGVLSANGKYLITILDSMELVLWDCQPSEAQELVKIKVKESSDPLCFFLLPESGNDEVLHLVAVYSPKLIRLYAVRLAEPHSLVDLGVFGLPIDEDEELQLAAVVDPVGWRAKLRGTLDEFERDVMTTISSQGTVRLWTARFQEDKLQWLQTSSLETGQQDIAKAQVSSTKKVVTTNSSGTKLFIWDLRNQLLEFEQEFNDDRVSDLDWTSTPDDQSVLGVGFAKQVMLYCQQRFDYTNKTPSWTPFKQVDISRYTSHPIGDSIWLKNGTFVVGAGNQFFIQDEKVDVNDPTTKELLGSRNTKMFDKSNSIFDVCAVLNGPLPLYHPQLLIQSVFAGKIHVVKRILVTLLKRLTFSPILEPSMVADIKTNLGLKDVFDERNPEMSDTSTPNGSTYSRLFRRDSFSDEVIFNAQTCEQLSDWFLRVSLPYLTRHQQITLASVVEALNQTEVHRRSLDENGVKYLLGFKLWKIHKGTQETMTMRDFNWALHSESQDILLELVEKGTNSTMFWPQWREVGIAYWLNHAKLVEQFEKLARNYFSHEGKRDPIGCSLYFLALRKKQILVGLWRTASWHKEQAKTMKLLQNDFTQPRWRSAALKNAFALLGKHRFEYAAAFFLLGDSLKDAVNVLVKHVQDVPLAIAVARVYGGDDGPVLRQLIDDHVLPQAEVQGDKWTTSWAHWICGNKQKAVQSLAFVKEQKDVKSFLVDDPVLVLLYRYLRDQSFKQTDKGGKFQALDVEDEFQYVLKMSSIYSRMGCDVLALDLIRSWRFVFDEPHDANEVTNGNGMSNYNYGWDEGPPKLERRPTLARTETSNTSTNGSLHTSMANLKPVGAQATQELDMSAFGF